MLDFDLAVLYGVETKRLKEAVRRNMNRFPMEFMFELTIEEAKILRSQIASSSWGGARYPPFAFTEHGVAMLSGVLNSPKAIEIHIAIIRAFIALRQYALTYSEMAELLQTHDKHLKDINEVLSFLAQENQQRAEEIEALKTGEGKPDDWKERRRIGFKK